MLYLSEIQSPKENEMLRFILFFSLLLNFQLTAQSLQKKSVQLPDYLTQEEIAYIKQKRVIIASNEYDYEPMDFNVNGVPVGYSIDLLNILATQVGLKVQYKTQIWSELLESLYNGQIDLMHTIYKTKKREESLSFSSSYLTGRNHFVQRKNDFKLTNLKDLSGKKVGVTKGWLEVEIISKNPNITKVYFSGLKEKLEALSVGKIDAIMNDGFIANYTIIKNGFMNLKVGKFVLERSNSSLDDYYFATLKSQAILISILNKAYMNTDINLLNKLQHKWFGNMLEKGESLFNLAELEYLSDVRSINACILANVIPLSHIENGKPQGIVADILFELQKIMDVPFSFIEVNHYSNTRQLIQDKKCNIIPIMEYEKKSLSDNLTSPYLDMSYVAVGKSDKKFFSDLSELKNITISVVQGTLKSEEIKNKYPSVETVTVQNTEEGLALVNSKKVYMHLDLYPVAKYYISKYEDEEFKIIGRLEQTLKLSMATQKENRVLASVIEKSLNQISKTKIDTIVKKWTEIEVRKVVNYKLLYQIIAGALVLIVLGVWRYRLLKNTNREIKLINKELQASQGKLLRQKEEFEAVFKESKDGIAIISRTFQFIDCNMAYEKMLGFSKAKLLETNFLDTVISMDKEEIKRVIKEIEPHKSIDLFEKVCLGKNQKRVSTNMTFTLMPDKNKVLLAVKDLTSLKLLESQSKLASMGEMIGNIAHQWRQPLSIITTSATGLSLKAEMQEHVENQEIIHFSNEVVQQCQYLSRTIDDFKEFIKDDMKSVPTSVKESLQSALSLTKASMKSNYIEVVETLEEDLIIAGNKNELGQAFINILNNAKDQLKEIAQSKQKRYIFVSSKKLDKETIELRIMDNGGGVNAEVINRIFEPYFTTKHQSVGTGLGLSLSDKIIRQRYKGLIQVYNETFEYEGKEYVGACFVIRLYAHKTV
ncbi:hypothetical protein CRV04_09210 [Candidatus Marinarcus aquaticus]|uniref:histidine kinase n=2 Tax=Candidatus Marinarcus aquaticus TaxID=2044504 RepID=A0A4Q0XNR3_9BACT|nr:hypothetical protein CRV04_09210 [Candidatus Marinarcus aquaticus]